MWAAMLSGNTLAPAFAAQVSTGTSVPTTTPIKNVVVIFGENISFDHYFGTYPYAANTGATGEPSFTPLAGTPSVNGIGTLPVAGTLPATGNNITEPGTGTELTGIGLQGGYATANDSVNVSSSLSQTSGEYTTAPTTVQPFRLSLAQATTCDNSHSYTPEQTAYHGGQIDLFVQATGCSAGSDTGEFGPADQTAVMGYFDGNVVQGFWNYAQHFAMSDNSYDSMYGPSAPGAVELISGNNHGVVGTSASNVPSYGSNQTTGAGEYKNISIVGANGDVVGTTGGSANGVATMLGDIRPLGDDCSPTGSAELTFGSSEKNVGDLLNAKGVSWGWFQGGFHATAPYTAGATQPTPPSSSTAQPATAGNSAVCAAQHLAADGGSDVKVDYIAHHQPFQFFTSTQNLHHFAPGYSSLAAAQLGYPLPSAAAAAAEIGNNGPANHQYDVSDLFNVTSVSSPTSQTYTITGLKAGVVLPAVTYIKAPGFMDGHPGYSNPILEQQFDIEVINALMQSAYWPNMAIMIAYDDSDGWYDHVVPPLVNPSALSTQDGLTGAATGLTPSGSCGVPAPGAILGRCGYGPRQPLMVISPWSKINFVDHTITDQTSILRFIEDNWNLGRIDPSPKPVSQGGSFDQIAGSLYNMFNFSQRHSLNGLILSTTPGAIGTVVSGANNL